ncbi:MAG TPA: DNA-processing protein DprA [Vicinamibacteria bacterium]|nr:DNA-processing protein DprA [Vicinamibacteria bacterium]
MRPLSARPEGERRPSALDLLTLALLPGVAPRAIRVLAGRGPLGDVLRDPAAHADQLGAEARSLLAKGEARRRAEAETRRAEGLGVRIVGWDDGEYPALLRRIFDPPPVLYVRGSLHPDEGERSVAVVGARAATPVGRALARAMARDLASWGATVVSGLARGIDTAAHQGALDAGGRTVAVLGCGIDRMYPRENAALADTLVGSGALVSEFPLGTPPLPPHFPRRNRIIAGWSRAVVVVEAAGRSGALNTARTAVDEGRDVMAVPGHPSQPASEGTNHLLREGAALVRHARDVAEELGFTVPAPPRLPDEASSDQVLGALRADAPLSLDDLQARCGLETPELLARLTQLELRDEVRRLPGALFVRHH